MWHAFPLIVAISLVYSATRHEETDAILVGAVRVAAWIVSFMAIVFVLLWVLSIGL